jgi:ABC-type transporter Mla subunit MlaD
MDKREETLRAVFTSLITLLESNHRRLDELAQIVFSLRAAVRGLDPTFDDVIQEKTEEIDSATQHLAQMREERFAELHQLIASLDLS